MWGPDQSGHICHHAVFVGILTLLVSSKMVASRASPRSGFLPLSLVLVVTVVGRIAATDIDKNRTVSSIFPGRFLSALQWLYVVKFSYSVNLFHFLSIFLYRFGSTSCVIFEDSWWVPEQRAVDVSELASQLQEHIDRGGWRGQCILLLGSECSLQNNNLLQFHFVCGILF